MLDELGIGTGVESDAYKSAHSEGQYATAVDLLIESQATFVELPQPNHNAGSLGLSARNELHNFSYIRLQTSRLGVHDWAPRHRLLQVPGRSYGHADFTTIPRAPDSRARFCWRAAAQKVCTACGHVGGSVSDE